MNRVIPKEGDTFNAYTNQYGNLARGAPFDCRRFKRGGKWRAAVDETNYAVNAVDKDGVRWQFRWLNKKQGHNAVERVQDWTFSFEIIKKADVEK